MPTVTLVRPEQVCPATVSTVFCTPQTLLHLHPMKHSHVSEVHIFMFKLIHNHFRQLHLKQNMYIQEQYTTVREFNNAHPMLLQHNSRLLFWLVVKCRDPLHSVQKHIKKAFQTEN